MGFEYGQDVMAEIAADAEPGVTPFGWKLVKATVLGVQDNGRVLVSVNGEDHLLERREVFRFEPLSDERQKEWAETQLPYLLATLREACIALLPKHVLTIKVDEPTNGVLFADGYVTIMPVVEQRKCIGVVREVMAWGVSTAVTVPGDRDTPDDVDVVERGSHFRIEDAVGVALRLAFEYELKCWADRKCDEAQALEYQSGVGGEIG